MRNMGNRSTIDNRYDKTLRPQKFDEFIGQEAAIDALRIAIEASKQRGQTVDHVLLSGPPGLGKTTIAKMIANELDSPFMDTSGPIIEERVDLASLLTNLEPHCVFFVDEIHRLQPAIEEILYPAMEDFCLDIMIGKGPSARSVRIDLPEFTLIGATTRSGLLTEPLRDRFDHRIRLDFYPLNAIQNIIMRTAREMDIPISESAAEMIAARSRGTPRVANSLLRRVRDYVSVVGEGRFELEICRAALDKYVDNVGMDQLDRDLLKRLLTDFKGGPVGLQTLAVSLSEDIRTIEDSVEPFLIRQGFLKRTSQGRVATEKAWDYFPNLQPNDLFTSNWTDDD